MTDYQSGQDLLNELKQLELALDEAINSMSDHGQELAVAEYKYRKEAAKQTLMYRDSGYPVTIIDTLVKGGEGVAELRLKRDLAEVSYQVSRELVMANKAKYKVVNEQIEREWNDVMRQEG